MIRFVAAVALVSLPALVSSPAWAEERPATVPTRDVDVTYRAGPPQQPVTQRSRWSAGSRKMRLDTPTPGIYVLVDYGAKRMSMVSDADHAVLDVPLPADGLMGQPASGAAFTRRDTAQVAGVGCTNWETLDSSGKPATACFTADGVLLEARRGDLVLVQAVRVAYGTLDAATFAVPPGYRTETAGAAK